METITNTLMVQLQQTELLLQLADEACLYRHECRELREKADSLRKKLQRLVACGPSSLCIRPMRRIMQELEKSLGEALVLVCKSKSSCVFQCDYTIVAADDFKRVNHMLENASADISWLLGISRGGGGLPPIVLSEPMISFFWENIALLERGTEDQKEVAAFSLGVLARDNDKHRRSIIEEGAVVPMLKVLTDGTPNARVEAAKALGYMARDASAVKEMIADGIAPAFVNILQSAPMRVQVEVARALCNTLAMDLSQQDTYMEHSAIQALVGLLGESLEEPDKMQQSVAKDKLVSSVGANRGQQDDVGSPAPKLRSQHRNKYKFVSLMPSTSGNPSALYSRPNQIPIDHGKGLLAPMETSTTQFHQCQAPLESQVHSHGHIRSKGECNRRERDNESAELKEELKAEVARALGMLVKGNSKTSKIVTTTKAFLCFAELMEKQKGIVRLNSVLALMEIAAVAEKDVELRKQEFRLSSPAPKGVVDQLLRLIDEDDPRLQVPCIKAIGCLSGIFPLSRTGVVKLLVRQLEATTESVAAEASMALEKFVSKENYHRVEHSKAIVEAMGVPLIVQLIYFGEGQGQISAVKLMCYFALHFGDTKALAVAEALPALKGLTKSTALHQHPFLEELVADAIMRLQALQDKEEALQARLGAVGRHGTPGTRNFPVIGGAFRKYMEGMPIHTSSLKALLWSVGPLFHRQD